MKKFILFIIIGLLINQSYAQFKNIYWLHGLTGKQEMMYSLLNKYEAERTCDGFTFQYSTDGGIEGSSAEMSSKMEVKNSSLIMVTQSMGGLNARDLFKRSQNGTFAPAIPFGGLITMGGPHAGAPVANCIENGVLDKLKADITYKGFAGPRNDFIIPFTFFNSIIEYTNALFDREIPCFADLIYYFVSEGLDKNISKSFGTEKARLDLKPTSQKVNELAKYNMNIPMIAIWGNENSPAFLRLAASRKDNEKQHFNAPWGGLNDDKYVKLVNIIKDYCNVWKVTYEVTSVANPLSWVGVETYAVFMKNNYTTSYNFWNGELQYSFDVLIGAFIKQERTYYSYQPVCPEPVDPRLKIMQQWYAECTEWDYVPYTVYETVPQPSDGIVPKSSAIALPGVGRIVEATGVNHEELKNHDEMGRIFGNIFNGVYTDSRDLNFFLIGKK